MKIIQITAVVENHDIYNGGVEADTEATIYGLADDGKMYYWGRTKTTRVKKDEPDEEGNTHHYEYEHGWKVYLP